MPLEVIQRSIGLLIGGFLPTDKQVNHILTPYVTYSYAHRLGSSIHDGVCKLSLKACTLWMEPAERNLYTTHKAGRAALGLSCGACFEQPNSVYFGCGAAHSGVTQQTTTQQITQNACCTDTAGILYKPLIIKELNATYQNPLLIIHNNLSVEDVDKDGGVAVDVTVKDGLC